MADFFGTTCYIIEEQCIESLEIENRISSKEGNKNPVAVPIIDESVIIRNHYKYIGELIVTSPLTYYLYDECNLVAIRVSDKLAEFFTPNTLLIVSRLKRNDTDQIVIITQANQLAVKNHDYSLQENEKLIGCIREERVNV